MWHVVGGEHSLKIQLPSSYGLGVKAFWRFGGKAWGCILVKWTRGKMCDVFVLYSTSERLSLLAPLQVWYCPGDVCGRGMVASLEQGPQTLEMHLLHKTILVVKMRLARIIPLGPRSSSQRCRRASGQRTRGWVALVGLGGCPGAYNGGTGAGGLLFVTWPQVYCSVGLF